MSDLSQRVRRDRAVSAPFEGQEVAVSAPIIKDRRCEKCQECEDCGEKVSDELDEREPFIYVEAPGIDLGSLRDRGIEIGRPFLLWVDELTNTVHARQLPDWWDGDPARLFVPDAPLVDGAGHVRDLVVTGDVRVSGEVTSNLGDQIVVPIGGR